MSLCCRQSARLVESDNVLGKNFPNLVTLLARSCPYSCFLQSALLGISALSMDITLQHYAALVVFKNQKSEDQNKQNKIVGKIKTLLFWKKKFFPVFCSSKKTYLEL
jgi:hypothetical protein